MISFDNYLQCLMIPVQWTPKSCIYGHICLYTYLKFVTDPTDISVEKKFVIWRIFRFLCMTDLENSEISPHVEYFQISPHDRCGEI